MPARTKYEPGTPSWTDLMTSDPDAAKTFYASLFGWTFEDMPTDIPDNPYTMVSKSGKTVAGMGRQFDDEMAQGIPPHWTTYVTVDDVEASASTAKRSGGNVIAEPLDVMDVDGIPPNWGVYLAVDDTDATVATATKGGGSVIAEPMEIPPGRMAVVSDPQGAVFSVLALAQPAD